MSLARDTLAIRHCSHDAQATLAALMDQLRLIQSGNLSPEGAGHVAAALGQTAALSRMIAATMAPLTGMENPSPANLDLPDLLDDIVLAHSARAAARGMDLVVTTDPTLPRALGMDSVTLERILLNLVGNALAHAGQGLVRVDCTLTAPQKLRIAIRDDGPGLPSAVLAAKLRTESINPKGLEVVATLVADLGGTMRLLNPPQGGALVQVDLPFAPVSTPEATPDLPLFDPAPLARVCTLAGPEAAAEILDRIALDLTETEAELTRAETDAGALPEVLHVLNALAGTAGATRLLARGQGLAQILQMTPAPCPVNVVAPALAELRGLIPQAVASVRHLLAAPLPRKALP